MNPFACALLAYHEGDHTAAFSIRRHDGFEARVPAAVFFSDQTFPPLEARALAHCKGHILDVGAAAGRHSLELLRRGFRVTSLDIEPEMERILKARGGQEIVISDIFDFSGSQFDTLLMLMNGIGMVGSVERLEQFLVHAHQLILPGGQIVCDSVDVSLTTDPVHVAHREKNLASGKLPGQQSFTISYEQNQGTAFDWLHLDFSTLSSHCRKTGWEAQLVQQDADGHYLCVMKDVQVCEPRSLGV